MTRSKFSTRGWLALTVALAACGGSEATKPKTTPPEPVVTSEPDKPAEPGEPGKPETPAEPEKPAEPTKPALTYLPGKFVWYELHTSAPAKAIAFYDQVLGWQNAEMDMQGTKLNFIQNGGKPIGIIMDADKTKKEPTHWVGYISVPDVDEAVQRIEGSGGKIVGPAFDIPEIGRFAAATDPEGAYFSVFKSLKGDEPDAKPAAGDWAWVELWSKKPETAITFYSAVADYKTQEMPMGKNMYRILVAGETPRGGVDKLPKGQKTPMWVPYVQVDNADDVVKKAKAAKAKIVIKPMDIANVGRVAVFTDPTGGTLGVVAPAAPTDQAAEPPAKK